MGNALLLRRLPHRLARALDARRAIFEFRDLAEWVERRVGQQIGGRLDERERDEHDALWDRVVLARVELDRAAPGRDPDALAGRDPELGDVGAREIGDRPGLERVLHAGASRHRTGWPVRELAA